MFSSRPADDQPTENLSRQSDGDKLFGQQFDPNLSKFNPPGEGGDAPLPEPKPKPRILMWLLILIAVMAFAGGIWWYFSTRIVDTLPPVANIETTNETGNVTENSTSTEPIEETPTEDPLADSDQDGLTDNDEITIWQTDPYNNDTDGDTYLDGDEVANGYSPTGSGKIVYDEQTGLPIVGNDNQATSTVENNSTTTTDVIVALATPEETVATFVSAINNNNAAVLIQTISPNHIQYQELVSDPDSILSLYQYSFEFKELRIDVQSVVPEEYPDTVTVSVKIYLDGEFDQDSSVRMEKIGEQWRILE